MFLFSSDVPANVQTPLTPFLEPWIDREDLPVFGLPTTRYGLVSFRRDPWPVSGATTVSPAGEVDLAALQALSLSPTQTIF